MRNSQPNSWRKILLYFNAFLLLALIGGGTYYAVRIYTRGQTCFTTDQVQQSDKCLYIYKTSVYEKGTKSAPHQGISCGTDVSSLIPESHLLDKVGHLDPNYQGEICNNVPVPTNTPTPSPSPSPSPSPVPTTPPTNTPAPVATNTPVPTQSSQLTNNSPTPTTTAVSTSTPTPTKSARATTSVTATPTSGIAVNNSPTPTTATGESPTVDPTPLQTLPVTGRIEWIAAALVPLGLVVLGVLF